MTPRRLPDRLYEILVDIHDEGPRTLGELRFYPIRSFLPDVPSRAAAIARLAEWLGTARAEGWLSPSTSWDEVDAWLETAAVEPNPPGPGPELDGTPALANLFERRLLAPEGDSAWTFPEGWDCGWSALA